MIVEDMNAPASVNAFSGTDTRQAPLRIDTATCDTDGVVYVEVSEVEMLRDVAVRATSRAETSTGGSDWTPHCRSLGSGTSHGAWADNGHSS